MSEAAGSALIAVDPLGPGVGVYGPSPWQRVRQLWSLARIKPFDTSSEAGRSMERYRRAALTAVAVAAARGTAILATMVTVPLTLGYLGMERYGLWMTISSVIAMLAFSDLGLGNGLMNAVSEANGRDDREAAQRYVSSAVILLSGFAILLAACFALGYGQIPWVRAFRVTSPLAVAEAGPAMAVFVGCFLLDILSGMVERVRLGYQEGFVNSLWDCLGSVLGLMGVLVAIRLRAGLPWLVLAMAGAPVFATMCNGVSLFVFERPWLRPRLQYFTGQAARRIAHLGILFFVLQVTGALAFASDNIVAAQVLGPEAVAQYSIPMKLFNVVPILLAMFMMPLWPAYGEAIARGDIAWVKKTLLRSLVTTSLVVLPVSAFLVILGRQIVRLWVGPQITPSLLLLLGLALWATLTAAGNSIAVFWNGASVVGFQIVFAALIGVGALGAKIWLAHAIGLPGVIWGTVIAYLVFAPLPTIIYLPRVLSRLQRRARCA